MITIERNWKVYDNRVKSDLINFKANCKKELSKSNKTRDI